MCKIKSVWAAFMICSMLATSLLGQSNSNSSVLSPKRLDKVLYQLEEFTKNKSLSQLNAAMGTLNSQPYTDRKCQTKALLDVLAAIDRHLDLNFSETNMTFFRNLVPPPSPDEKVQYPSGVDSSVITNLVTKAGYEAELKANREKAETYVFQLQLSRLERQAALCASNYIKSNFGCSEADQKEFGQLISDSYISTDRKKSLLKLIRN